MTGNSRACGRRVLTVVPAPKTRSGVPVGLEQEGVGSHEKIWPASFGAVVNVPDAQVEGAAAALDSVG